jgi:hypothetical protein
LEPGPGDVSTLRYTHILPEGAKKDEVEQHELLVTRDDLAVVRFAGATGTEEHVEFIGGRTDDPRSELDEDCFAYRGRQGELRVLDFERAHTIARYIGTHMDRLRRLDGRGTSPARRIPRQRRIGHHPAGRPSAAASGTTIMMVGRQQQVIDQITELATHDYVLGIFEPATARERAVMRLGDAALPPSASRTESS